MKMMMKVQLNKRGVNEPTKVGLSWSTPLSEYLGDELTTSSHFK